MLAARTDEASDSWVSSSLRRYPTAPDCSAESAASRPLSEAQTITRAPVASRTRGDEILAAGQRRVEDHEVTPEQRRVLPRVADALGITDGFDLFQLFQARHETPPVDRMGVQDEELHP